MKSFAKKIVVAVLTWEAKMVLKKYQPRVVAVTGSMGKTSTKDAIFTVLAESFFVRKSQKSLNSEIGVPLAILGCESGWNNPLKWISIMFEGFALVLLKNHYPRWLVLEVGADRPGDIRNLARWLNTDIAVITGVPELPPHIEYFDSAAAVVAEKRALAESLTSEGRLVLNGDEEHSFAMRTDFRGLTTTYGFADHNDVAASHESAFYSEGRPSGVQFRVNYQGSSIPLEVHNVIGRTHVYPALAAFAVGVAAGMDAVSIGRAFEHHQPAAGRMRLISGINGSTIIDDTYNASPTPAYAALDTLDAVQTGGRKIAVIGDMLELGKHTGEAHRKLGEYAARIADIIVTIGMRAQSAGEVALDAGLDPDSVRQYGADQARQAGDDLRLELQPGDVVLVKGSQGMRMERTVKRLMAEPERAGDLLVRQEREWLQR